MGAALLASEMSQDQAMRLGLAAFREDLEKRLKLCETKEAASAALLASEMSQDQAMRLGLAAFREDLEKRLNLCETKEAASSAGAVIQARMTGGFDALLT